MALGYTGVPDVEVTSLLKFFIVVLMLALLLSLASGFYFLMADQGDKNKQTPHTPLPGGACQPGRVPDPADHLRHCQRSTGVTGALGEFWYGARRAGDRPP